MVSKNSTYICTLLLVISALSLFSQTTISSKNGKWQLFVDEQPYIVKGVTFGFEAKTSQYDTRFKELQFLGVNTIRTWATGENTLELLNAANRNGIKVMLGIWMRHGRPGMEDDDSFDYLEDSAGKETMYQNAIDVVETYKHHPAILTWGIGNEVYLNMATDEEKLVYSQLLERICKSIKLRDPNHPTTSVEAWNFGLDWWRNHVPSLDIYGLNSYGPGANLLQEELKKRGIDKPYLITEFGVTGEWDVKQKLNGITKEPSDSQKFNAIKNGYKNWIKNKSSNLGVFVFHYSDGKNFISPWLFTHYKTMTRPQYWAIREAFTGEKPINHVPIIHSFELLKSHSESEEWIPLSIKFSDIENEFLELSFAYNQRTGSRKRRDQLNPIEHRGNLKNGFEIKMPKEDGPIKIYAFVKDTFHNVGIASTGIILNDNEAKSRKYLVPKVELPFYVYKDGENTPYFASAFMGNYKDMKVDTKYKSSLHSGTASLKISYELDHNWYGLSLVDPANDWGEILGGYDISNAKKFVFWAKANKNKVIATIGFGLIGNDKPFPDTAKKSIEVKLSTKWKKFSFSTKKLDLSCIRSGLTIFSNSYGNRQDIYIDDVYFE